MKLTDKQFRYHNSASHSSADGLKARMRAEQRKIDAQKAADKVSIDRILAKRTIAGKS